MKLYIKSKGNGWFTVATNFKDKEDSCTISLFFPKNVEEPAYIPTADGKAYTIAINPIEWKFNSYKGKPGMTIFKYELIAEAEETKATQNVKIEESELPFY